MSRDFFNRTGVIRVISRLSREKDLGVKDYYETKGDDNDLAFDRKLEIVQAEAGNSTGTKTELTLRHNLGRVPKAVGILMAGSTAMAFEHTQAQQALWTKDRIVFSYTNTATPLPKFKLLVL